jgi:hypothetical protein
MAHRKKKPPIDRAALYRWVEKTERTAGAPLCTREVIDKWAAEHLDGKTRDEQEEAIVGPWLEFLMGQMRESMRRMAAQLSAQHPSEN